MVTYNYSGYVGDEFSRVEGINAREDKISKERLYENGPFDSKHEN